MTGYILVRISYYSIIFFLVRPQWIKIQGSSKMQIPPIVVLSADACYEFVNARKKDYFSI